MLAHLEGFLNKRKIVLRIWDVRSAYRLLLIGDKQSPLASARAILKFLKEEPDSRP